MDPLNEWNDPLVEWNCCMLAYLLIVPVAWFLLSIAFLVDLSLSHDVHVTAAIVVWLWIALAMGNFLRNWKKASSSEHFFHINDIINQAYMIASASSPSSSSWAGMKSEYTFTRDRRYHGLTVMVMAIIAATAYSYAICIYDDTACSSPDSCAVFSVVALIIAIFLTTITWVAVTSARTVIHERHEKVERAFVNLEAAEQAERVAHCAAALRNSVIDCQSAASPSKRQEFDSDKQIVELVMPHTSQMFRDLTRKVLPKWGKRKRIFSDEKCDCAAWIKGKKVLCVSRQSGECVATGFAVIIGIVAFMFQRDAVFGGPLPTVTTTALVVLLYVVAAAMWAWFVILFPNTFIKHYRFPEIVMIELGKDLNLCINDEKQLDAWWAFREYFVKCTVPIYARGLTGTIGVLLLLLVVASLSLIIAWGTGHLDVPMYILFAWMVGIDMFYLFVLITNAVDYNENAMKHKEMLESEKQKIIIKSVDQTKEECEEKDLFLQIDLHCIAIEAANASIKVCGIKMTQNLEMLFKSAVTAAVSTVLLPFLISWIKQNLELNR